MPINISLFNELYELVVMTLNYTYFVICEDRTTFNSIQGMQRGKFKYSHKVLKILLLALDSALLYNQAFYE